MSARDATTCNGFGMLRCPRCSYPLVGLCGPVTCPECGHACRLGDFDLPGRPWGAKASWALVIVGVAGGFFLLPIGPAALLAAPCFLLGCLGLALHAHRRQRLRPRGSVVIGIDRITSYSQFDTREIRLSEVRAYRWSRQEGEVWRLRVIDAYGTILDREVWCRDPDVRRRLALGESRWHHAQIRRLRRRYAVS